MVPMEGVVKKYFASKTILCVLGSDPQAQGKETSYQSSQVYKVSIWKDDLVPYPLITLHQSVFSGSQSASPMMHLFTNSASIGRSREITRHPVDPRPIVKNVSGFRLMHQGNL